MDVGEFSGRRLYTGFWLHYRLTIVGSYIRIARYLCCSWAFYAAWAIHNCTYYTRWTRRCGLSVRDSRFCQITRDISLILTKTLRSRGHIPVYIIVW